MGKMWWHHVCGAFVFLTVSLISFTPPCDGGNILVFPVDGSHWINTKILLEELHARGHNLTVIRASTSWYIPEKSPLYTSITIQMEGQGNAFYIFLQEQLKVCNCECV
ncbi:UDP-glucuronosyltransferase 2A1-like [Sphaeramia orbicularis]|uniref:UDP-glucuronosyltransferase 2A1-like n=1 Tax=Sphaeramia orbicularis TaxID=375764 RepID=UPI001181428F|nr:UDP-glucuronosyltransferase 2A1-like [Sphaeramia orbicularis]